jgi:hypothetical protein
MPAFVPISGGVVSPMAPALKMNYTEMVAVVNELDNLIAYMGSSGEHGSYASVQQASNLAQAICSVAQVDTQTLVGQYNGSYGGAAASYQSLANSIIDIRNAVAKVANGHTEHDFAEAQAFAPLNLGDNVDGKGHEVPNNTATGSGGTTGSDTTSSTTAPTTSPSTTDSGGGRQTIAPGATLSGGAGRDTATEA